VLLRALPQGLAVEPARARVPPACRGGWYRSSCPCSYPLLSPQWAAGRRRPAVAVAIAATTSRVHNQCILYSVPSPQHAASHGGSRPEHCCAPLCPQSRL